MKNIVVSDSLVLLPGQVISVSVKTALTLQLACGRVWVTIEGDAVDYWLSDGDSLLLASARHVVIEADKAFSRIDFLPCRRQRASPEPETGTAASAAAACALVA